MKIRSIWNGYLKISLVQLPVCVYAGLNTSEAIQFNQLHRTCHQRIKQKLFCPTHGEIKREEIVKGYEFEKEKYVVITDADLEAVRLETTKTIEIGQFVRPKELDPVYFDMPYFIGPDGPVAVEGFCVLHQALLRTGLIGVGRVVLGGREKRVILRPVGKGLQLTTLRATGEIRNMDSVFADMRPTKVDPEQLQLAQKLIEQKTRSLGKEPFTDRYQTALVDLIQAKIKGGEPVVVPTNSAHNVVSLMDALRQSIADSGGAKVSSHKRTRSKIAA